MLIAEAENNGCARWGRDLRDRGEDSRKDE